MPSRSPVGPAIEDVVGVGLPVLHRVAELASAPAPGGVEDHVLVLGIQRLAMTHRPADDRGVRRRDVPGVQRLRRRFVWPRRDARCARAPSRPGGSTAPGATATTPATTHRRPPSTGRDPTAPAFCRISASSRSRASSSSTRSADRAAADQPDWSVAAAVSIASRIAEPDMVRASQGGVTLIPIPTRYAPGRAPKPGGATRPGMLSAQHGF